jgi:hypothetical protein
MAPIDVTDGIVWLTTDEVLLRQVHPAQMKGTQPTSQAFKRTAQHDHTLSVMRQYVGAKVAYDRHVAAGLQSSGTWGISVAECTSVDLDAFDDSGLPDTPQGHVSIPFGIPEGAQGRKRIEKQAKYLKDCAIARGCLYAPPPPGALSGFLPPISPRQWL